MTNIITSTNAYRNAMRAIQDKKSCIASVSNEVFKALYVSHSNYGKYWGEDFENTNDPIVKAAKKFKAVVNLVQNGHLWLDIPAARAAAIGLDSAGSWVFSEDNISLDDALKLVKATESEANEIRNLWNTIGIRDDGYVIDEDGEEVPYCMPPTSAVVNWMAL